MGNKENCGGLSKSQKPSELDEDGKAAESFVRARVPQLANAALLSFKTQLVSGFIYYFTFAGYEGEVEVWQQKWSNLLRITLPNGTSISNQQ